MTCIAAMVDKKTGEVWMGSDGVVSFGDFQTQLVHPKIFRRGDLLIGAAGSPRVAQVLQYTPAAPELPNNGEDVYCWLCTDFAEWMREALEKAGTLKDESGTKGTDTSFLVACAGRLFCCDSVFAFYECKRGFDTCGSGSEVAIGYMMAAIENNASVEDCVRGAVEAASQIIASVAPPFHILKL